GKARFGALVIERRSKRVRAYSNLDDLVDRYPLRQLTGGFHAGMQILTARVRLVIGVLHAVALTQALRELFLSRRRATDVVVTFADSRRTAAQAGVSHVLGEESELGSGRRPRVANGGTLGRIDERPGHRHRGRTKHGSGKRVRWETTSGAHRSGGPDRRQ